MAIASIRFWILLGPPLIILSIPLTSALSGRIFIRNDYVLNRWLKRLFSVFFVITPIILCFLEVFAIYTLSYDNSGDITAFDVAGYAIFEFFKVPDLHEVGIQWLFIQLLVILIAVSVISVLYGFGKTSNSLFFGATSATVSVFVFYVSMIGEFTSSGGGIEGTSPDTNTFQFAGPHFDFYINLGGVVLVVWYLLLAPFLYDKYRIMTAPEPTGEEKYLFPKEDKADKTDENEEESV